MTFYKIDLEIPNVGKICRISNDVYYFLDNKKTMCDMYFFNWIRCNNHSSYLCAATFDDDNDLSLFCMCAIHEDIDCKNKHILTESEIDYIRNLLADLITIKDIVQ